MPIPESQLETWSKQGSVTQSATTYETVRNVLASTSAPYAAKDFDIFLQGSYCNHTNIFADSDVDIVIKLNSVYYYDLRDLSEAQKTLFEQARSPATYGYDDFKKEVTSWLTSKFGDAVKPGNKAIFIKGNASRRDVDVLPAVQFRRYQKFGGDFSQSYAEGICFFDKEGDRIVNFPKQHSENCTAKNKSTSLRFKPMVRVLKNMRNRMIEVGVISEGLAPSYFLEGLLYNVPLEKFYNSLSDTFVESINWILKADRSQFVCANEQYYLLRENSKVTWRNASCDRFLDEVCELWKNW